MKLKVNDHIIVIAGKSKGKTGKILKINHKTDRVIVEKVNLVKKHKKKSGNAPGERKEMEAPIHVSNVMLLDPKDQKPTRIGYRVRKDGKKERYAKKSGTSLS